MAPLRASEPVPARPRWPALLASLALAIILGFSGCQTADPPEAETVLWVRLNDSLSKFSKVVVQVVDRNDSDLIIHTLWNAKLPSPGTDIQGYSLKSLANKPFVVNVKAYLSDGQMALYTQIDYENGKKTVYHKQVPPLIPRDWLTKLTPSLGTLMPPFHKDSLTYILDIAKNTAVTFSMTTASTNAITSVDGERVPTGGSSTPYTVLDRDTLPILVTDLSTGTASTRRYNVVIIPTAPPSPALGSLVPSIGGLNPPFSPDTWFYSLTLPKGVDTVTFTLTPAAQTMTMNVGSKAIFAGQRSQVFKADSAGSVPVYIEVFEGTERAIYLVSFYLYGQPTEP